MKTHPFSTTCRVFTYVHVLVKIESCSKRVVFDKLKQPHTHTQVNLLEMSNAEVEAFLIGMGEPKYRAKQVNTIVPPPLLVVRPGK